MVKELRHCAFVAPHGPEVHGCRIAGTAINGAVKDRVEIAGRRGNRCGYLISSSRGATRVMATMSSAANVVSTLAGTS